MAPQVESAERPIYPDDHKDGVVGVDMDAEESILVAAGVMGKAGPVMEPLLHARRLAGMVGLVEGSELCGEDMDNEIGKALAYVGINCDAKTEPVLGHELNAG